MFGLTSQIRRAAASIPANIAEGYIQYLRIAQGSLKELETHLLLASRVDLAEKASTEVSIQQCEALGRMLRSLIRSLQQRVKKV